MRVETAGALVVRIWGAFLVLRAVWYLVAYNYSRLLGVPTGWTSYAPLHSRETASDIIYSYVALNVPFVFQAVFGFLLIRYSMALGRFLTKGLRDDAP